MKRKMLEVEKWAVDKPKLIAVLSILWAYHSEEHYDLLRYAKKQEHIKGLFGG
jgi:hypothetical protein